MTLFGTSTIILGIVLFLIGYWYLGKSTGQSECERKPDGTTMNYGSGIAGMVIGIILMVTGLVMNLTNSSGVSNTPPVVYDESVSS